MVSKKPQKCTLKEILEAIKKSGGIKQTVAKRLDISRHTVTNYQMKYPSVAKALKAERDSIKDKAESNIFAKIRDGDTGISQWFLRYKGGYVEKTESKVEVNAKVKKSVTVKVTPKMAKMIGDALVREEAEDEK